MIGFELFGIWFDQFPLANNIQVFHLVQYLVSVQTLIGLEKLPQNDSSLFL